MTVDFSAEALRRSWDLGPRLVTVAPGGREEWENETALAVTSHASRKLGRLPSLATYLDLAEPCFGTVMAENDAPAVVVPLLLSTGRLMRRDLPARVAASSVPVRMSRPLGPHPLLAEVMCQRLSAAGARRGDPVVLVADTGCDVVPLHEQALTGGPFDPLHDLELAGRMLQARWGAPVLVSTVGGAGRAPAEAITEARTMGRAAVAPYVLSPGLSEHRIKTLAHALRVGAIADVIGAHPLVADLVVRRYRALLAAARAAA